MHDSHASRREQATSHTGGSKLGKAHGKGQGGKGGHPSHGKGVGKGGAARPSRPGGSRGAVQPTAPEPQAPATSDAEIHHDYSANLTADGLRGKRIGVLRSFYGAGSNPNFA